jgi:hypothetical protein
VESDTGLAAETGTVPNAGSDTQLETSIAANKRFMGKMLFHRL